MQDDTSKNEVDRQGGVRKQGGFCSCRSDNSDEDIEALGSEQWQDASRDRLRVGVVALSSWGRQDAKQEQASKEQVCSEQVTNEGDSNRSRRCVVKAGGKNNLPPEQGAEGYKVCRDAGRLRRTSGQIGGREEDHSGESSSSRKETQQPVTKRSHQRTPFLCCYRELWEMIGCAKGWGRRGCGFMP